MAFILSVIVLALACTLPVISQDADLPNSFPHAYPGQPKGDFSPEWQNYFLVTDPLPNVTFPLGRSFAGNIPVQREGHLNDTLFFLAFETSNGSLTAPAAENNTAPWGIWLNGGPGSSSMYGAFFQNGPIRLQSDYGAQPNNYSWDRLADWIWVDQPVGVGFSTADTQGYIASEDQMGLDFMGFLENLVKVFPSLATRPLYITGESYAGVYIPYILKTYFNMENPPVKIAKAAIGDGSMTEEQVFELLPALHVIETFPQVIGYDPEVYLYFKQQTHLCHYDINLTYPQNGPLAPVSLVLPSGRDVPFFAKQMSSNQFMNNLFQRSLDQPELSKRDLVEREERRLAWKRDLSDRQNGTLDPWYGCLLFDMFMDYAINYTYPWTLGQNATDFGFDVYNAPDALLPRVNADASVFLNDERTRTALHAPTSKDWVMSFQNIFNGTDDETSPVPMTFLSDLATNMTAHNVGIVFYSGNSDTLISHFSTELTIQNTTFGGIQGFTRKPSTPWDNDNGEWAGVVHQERGWSYVLFYGAGHLVPSDVPAAAFTFLREFVLGSNQTGLVTESNGKITVVGGENETLAGDNIPGADGVFMGSGATQSTYYFPEATRAAWRSFIVTETAKPSGAFTGLSSNSEVHWPAPSWFTLLIPCIILAL
ncbi:alpha/beta-hydrolase [Pluteus cervinus]|uniref:Alpha/beta-hydrolase n=1 Tax=Pluteus cervinus TaxID=181527 RepID=A0ACD3BBH3_9AGAR|nr:alpha/beta-hydrolase [Pluteus cervinus]